MSWFNKKQIDKYCEWCGKKVIDQYYTVIFSVAYTIDGTSPKVKNINRNLSRVTLENGETLNYTFEIEPNIFAYTDLSSEHLLCSEKCEDNFISNHFIGFTQGSQPVHNHLKLGIFNPIAASSSQLGGEKVKCEICGTVYKSNGRNWMRIPLIETTQIKGSFNIMPSVDRTKFSLVLSGMSEKNKSGEWYCYKVNMGSGKKSSFCSYDCAFSLVEKENVVVLVNSVLEKDRLGVIVKETELFNNLLENKVRHRPSFFQPISR